jgi:hypothetical protein
MDELKIKSRFTRAIASKFVAKKIKNNVGVNANVYLNDLDISTCNDRTHIHLDFDADMTQEEFKKLLEKLGF